MVIITATLATPIWTRLVSDLCISLQGQTKEDFRMEIQFMDIVFLLHFIRSEKTLISEY